MPKKYGARVEDSKIKEGREKLENVAKSVMNELEGYGIPKDAIFRDMKGEKHDKFYGEENWLENGGVFDIYAKNGAFIRRYSERGKLKPYLVNGTSDNIVDVETDNVEGLRRVFKMVQEQVNETTHWYIKSSKEYKAFRDSIDQLVKGDLTDKNFLYSKMEEVAKNADLYLASKEEPSAKISSNTIPRIKAAHHVSMMMKGCLAPIIEKGIDFHKETINDFEVLQHEDVMDEDSVGGVTVDEEFENQVSNDVEPEKNVEVESVAPEKTENELNISDDDIVVENDSDMFL